MGTPALHHLALAALLAAAVSRPATAQSSTVGIEPYVEYGKRIESAQNLAPPPRLAGRGDRRERLHHRLHV